ncbi:hypothetical protein KX928_05970 [Roseobacter sp. YSTF-M11]|uniref:Uncharacterized protein n=1 Tax=Roseobacter insulae TaxID=2859783 RepID=A0A9X1FTW5_9RHOB|nr:hypothetical protein [Roseobacter insulae]MBW4707329.1 hypothetical protein [Roseobacter insulae]
MTPFVIPPRISSGRFGVGDDWVSSNSVEWKHRDAATGLDNGEGMITTSIGRLTIGDRTVQLVLGYRSEDMLPFLSWTVFAPAGENSWCSFNFEEVQQ